MHPINKLLKNVGFRVVRVRNASPAHADGDGENNNATHTLVGNFDITIPSSNPLYHQYRDNPDYTAELGRIAAHVHAKYPGMICVDVGANVGDTAAIIRSACPAPIVCIEGDQLAAEILVKNAELMGGLDVKQVYLSDSSGTQQVTISKQGWNSTLVPTDDTAFMDSVTFLTLDEALGEIDLQTVKLLKVDAEGYDPRVLRGSRSVLETGRPVVLFEYNRENLWDLGEDGLRVFDNFRALGYKSALFWEARGRFMLHAMLDDTSMIEDLHHYVDRQGQPLASVPYLDVCVFHEQDDDLAEKCLAGEREARDRRRSSGQPARA